MDQLHACFPPYIYLCQVADHIPSAMRFYLFLWREAQTNTVSGDSKLYLKDEIENQHFFNWDSFITHCRDLAYEGLLEYEIIKDDKIVIILFQDYSIGGIGHTLC
ncbi:MAG TPA: hypothetical protein VNW29_04310 [Candidatus Sulfotelmatobacter sp.]|jgi:hypothetical protein|nr:hypothetical protein [Candidatus Sulfotelmatobacter sp.]